MKETMKKIGAVLLGVGLTAGTQAATASWTGGGASQTNWADADNWGGVLPVANNGSAGDLIQFDVTNNYAIFDSFDANEEGTNEWPNASYYRMIRVGVTAPGRLDVVSGTLVGDDTWQHRVGVAGNTGTLNISGGLLNVGSSYCQIGLDTGSTGIINLSGGTYIWGRESGGVSGYIGDRGYGEMNVSGGTFRTRAGIVLGNVGGTGVFHVSGTNALEIGIGSHLSVNGSWLQNSNSVLKTGIDTGGITPILIDDTAADGPGGVVDATFAAGSLLEPYFVSSPVTGKWAVLTVDGSITDEGIGFSTNVTDTNWSFTVVSNYILEVWYGLGDSGYTTPTNGGPVIVYTNGTVYWDGEAGDNNFDNPTNWALDVTGSVNPNNVLPNTGNTGAEMRFETISTASHPIYTTAQGERVYERIQIGLDADGQLDVIGSGSPGWTLKADAGGTYYIGAGGNTGVLNIDASGQVLLNSATAYIGRDAGSTGIVTVANNGRLIFGRESAGTSAYIGADGAYGELNLVNNARFYTRAGITVDNGIFSVEGSGADIRIGGESSVDGNWVQNSGSTLQALVTSNGVSTIKLYEKTGGGVYAAFNLGSELDVDFSGYNGENGSWDLLTWVGTSGTLTQSNLTFAAGVDTNTWSFAFVDTDTNAVVDTLRITATGMGPTQDPVITGISVSGSDVTISWTDEGIGTYTVQRKTALADASWTDVTGGLPAGTGSTSVAASGADEEYYQIKGE